MTKHRKRRRTHARPRRRWKWTMVATAFVLLTGAQFMALHRLDQYLGPSNTPPPEDTSSKPQPPKQAPPAPADAVLSKYSSDKQYMAYTTADHQLIVEDASGTLNQIPVEGQVTYMEWLGSSGTLLYFVQGTYLTAYLLQAAAEKPVMIQQWYGGYRTVVATYFSPYLEYLYMELQNGQIDEVYKYDAVYGVIALPLPQVRIRDIQYDDKSDIMTLHDTAGNVWTYKNDKLYLNGGLYQAVTTTRTSSARR
ncbi:hypothetical protein GCM10025857_01100 [Alicyclobacillus contaminans]|uniref:hypothetical protein n=1 Tax=Alicyclobacillus contaminans TaxID=392016 RepID=UPI00047C55AF|nr:hypothetical protein [Alicyclobacillus contaminans]GMA48753.1 hypothetical protein GCM10025857_01100 [Alicyclobacillus contaminans]